MKKLSLPVKALLAIAFAVVAYFTLQYTGLLPSAQKQESAVPTQVALGEATPAATGNVAAVPLPTTQPGKTKGPVVRVNLYPWTAQLGLMFATGGPLTTKGSLMEKHDVSVRITAQNDLEKSKAEQIKFATALAGGQAQPGDGAHFVILMGDGAASYLGSINKTLEKLGSEYVAEVIGAVGYSRGEDAWFGPQSWKDNAEAMKGGATAAVLRDGDWNLAQYKLANDGIKNNPDETTWDPDAMNWFATEDHLKAVELYVSGYCEDRPIVRNGRVTNEAKHRTCVEGVATWTPGDVNLAKNKGGLVPLISTRENAYQMPAAIIGIRKWNIANSGKVVAFLRAAFEGADQVRSHDAALQRAGQAAYAVYGAQSPGYWVKYYRGVIERDKTQQPVPLGGSVVIGLADNLVLFGLAEGSGGIGGSVFKASYEGFGNIVKQQYPRLMPDFPPVDRAVNTAFLQKLAETMPAENAEQQTFEATPIEKANVVASRNWNIQFETGKATFTPAAIATMQDLYNQLVVGTALQVSIEGHTDNVGNPQSNQMLSEARAVAVKMWLEQKAPTLFPQNRLQIRGLGQTQPIASNETPDGRAKNRRVTVTLGTKG